MTQNIKTINLKGKEYVMVSERLRLLHEQKRDFEVLDSSFQEIAGRVLCKVTILVDGKKFTGNAEAKVTNAAPKSADSTNPFECGETSALGRALAFAGMGTVDGIASFDEIARGMSQDDLQAGVQGYIGSAMNAGIDSPSEQEPAILTEQQLSSIRKLYNHLGQSEPEHLERLPYMSAKKLIQQLTSEYRAIREAQPIQSKAVAEMITRAKQRCASIGVNWEDAKTDVNLRTVADTDLTVQQTATINGAITQYEKNRKSA